MIFRSIVGRLAAIITVTAIVSAASVPIVGRAHQQQIATRVIEDQIRSIETSAVPVLAYFLWTVNDQLARQMVRGLVAQPAVTRVRINWDGGDAISMTGPDHDDSLDREFRWPILYDRGGEPFALGTLHVWFPSPQRLSRRSAALFPEILGGLVAVAVAIVTLTVVARRLIVIPLRSLTRDITQLGDAVELPEWWHQHQRTDHLLEPRIVREEITQTVARIGEELTVRRQAEQELAVSLGEKEVLLQEVHHRVKNNLQLVMSLLSLQRGTLEDESSRAALEDSRNRVMSMAIVHELLYQGNQYETVIISDYLESLAGGLHPGDRSRIMIQVEAEPIHVTIDVAIPVGLIVSELVTNAMKHAFSESGAGIVRIEASATENRSMLSIRVRDNGRGLPEGWTIAQSTGLGMQIVSALTAQLRTTLQARRVAGETEFAFELSLG